MYVEGLPELPDDQPDAYLRRNIWGMGNFRKALWRCGMVFDGPQPDFPRHELDWDDPAHYDDRGEPVSPEAKAHRAAVDRTLRTHGEGHALGIPLWKFSSNDGWHVTAVECAQALEAYERYLADGGTHPDEFYDDAIPFLINAAKHDGFKVY